jgi:anti-anti-sigma regulatory factor
MKLSKKAKSIWHEARFGSSRGQLELSMMRITRVTGEDTNGHAITLRLEGKLLGPWVGELVRECDAVRAREGGSVGVVLDLTAVTFLDPAGTTVIRDLMRQGFEVQGCSRFVSGLLQDISLENA